MNVTEFLEARIAEDEAAAKLVADSDIPGTIWCAENDGALTTIEARAESAFTERFNPARVLAECAAKRRAVEYYRMLIEQSEQSEVFGYHATGLKVALRFMAAAYADHPDYQQEWQA